MSCFRFFLYKDAEFNVRADNEDGKTASEYTQFDCLGTYDTLSEIGKKKREFVCRGVEVKLRLIVLRTCACGLIPHLYRNKPDVVEREEGGPGSESSGGRSGGEAPTRGPGAEPLSGGSGGFSAVRHGTMKCNFTAAPQAGKERFLWISQIK